MTTARAVRTPPPPPLESEEEIQSEPEVEDDAIGEPAHLCELARGYRQLQGMIGSVLDAFTEHYGVNVRSETFDEVVDRLNSSDGLQFAAKFINSVQKKAPADASPKTSLMKLICNYLQKIHPKGASPRDIAINTGLSTQEVWSRMSMLRRTGWIVKLEAGIWAWSGQTEGAYSIPFTLLDEGVYVIVQDCLRSYGTILEPKTFAEKMKREARGIGPTIKALRKRGIIAAEMADEKRIWRINEAVLGDYIAGAAKECGAT